MATTASRSRGRKRSHKSPYDLVNIKKIISATESESEESERFHFLQRKRHYCSTKSTQNCTDFCMVWGEGGEANQPTGHAALQVSVEVSIKRQSVTTCG